VTYIDEEILAALRARYGEPRLLSLELPISEAERDLVVGSSRGERFHDVTLFVLRGDLVAFIRKPHYTPGLWRPPGGGLKRGEVFEDGARREALEELGVPVELERYLVHVEAVFTHADERIPWRTLVFAATTSAEKLEPLDTEEISEARWGTLEELAGPIRERLLQTGRALWRYRVALHDAAIESLRAGAGPTEPPRLPA
jgi:ADP-ribose pyrophosphatase YjhB (NUDIX family)